MSSWLNYFSRKPTPAPKPTPVSEKIKSKPYVEAREDPFQLKNPYANASAPPLPPPPYSSVFKQPSKEKRVEPTSSAKYEIRETSKVPVIQQIKKWFIHNKCDNILYVTQTEKDLLLGERNKIITYYSHLKKQAQEIDEYYLPKNIKQCIHAIGQFNWHNIVQFYSQNKHGNVSPAEKYILDIITNCDVDKAQIIRHKVFKPKNEVEMMRNFIISRENGETLHYSDQDAIRRIYDQTTNPYIQFVIENVLSY
jgi:hypothetical protein